MATAPPPNATPWEPTRLVSWLDRIEHAIDRLNLFELLELPTTGSGEHVQMAYHQIARTRHPDLFRGRLTARDAERLMRVYARIAGAYASLRDPNERTRYIYELRQLRGGRPSTGPQAATAVADHGIDPSTGIAIGRTPTGSGRIPIEPAIARTRTGSPAGPVVPPRTMTPQSVQRPSTGSPGPVVPPRTMTPQSIPPRTLTPQAIPPRTMTPQSIPPRTLTPQSVERPRTGSPAPPPGKSQPIPARGAPLSTPPPLGPPRLPVAGPGQLAPRALAFYRRAETALAGGDIAAATLNVKMALSADPSSPLLREAMAELQRGK